MKIIELLNKIAKGEEIPHEIRYKGKIYKWCNDIGDYREDGWASCLIIKDIFGTFDCCGRHNSLYNMIFDEVEIIEEDKKIYKLDWVEGNTFNRIQENSYLSRKEIELLDSNFKELGNKINEIIDYINKGDKE